MFPWLYGSHSTLIIAYLNWDNLFESLTMIMLLLTWNNERFIVTANSWIHVLICIHTQETRYYQFITWIYRASNRHYGHLLFLNRILYENCQSYMVYYILIWWAMPMILHARMELDGNWENSFDEHCVACLSSAQEGIMNILLGKIEASEGKCWIQNSLVNTYWQCHTSIIPVE